MGSFGDRCRKDKQIKNLEVSSYILLSTVLMNETIKIVLLFPQNLCAMYE